MHAKTFSATLQGIDGLVIEVEAVSQKSLPQIHITGLPGDVIRESRERVRACLVNLGFDIPSSRLVIHLSPASARKQGSQFDLAIAMGVLVSEGMLFDSDLSAFAFLGELSLDGRIQPIPGAVALIEALEREPQIKTILLPQGNEWEAGLASRGKVKLVNNIVEVIDFIRGKMTLESATTLPKVPQSLGVVPNIDLVRGQSLAKRAMQIALAGRHHLLLVGPPGVGKSLLAGCAPALLPPLADEEMIEIVKNYSLLFDPKTFNFRRPFRSPHHSVSASALLGGGSGQVIPGEVTLAHGGVLFLDEFPEFRRDVVEGIREPLQSGEIHLHRIGHALRLPARFTLIAAMNPCPCGYSLSPQVRCRCPVEKIRGYRKRVSGPLLDRMDLCVVLNPPRTEAPGPIRAPFTQREIGLSIQSAWVLQEKRFRQTPGVRQNGDLAILDADLDFHLEKPEKDWLDALTKKELMSYRGLAKILKVARTIADLEQSSSILLSHLSEAWSLRCQSLSTELFGF